MPKFQDRSSQVSDDHTCKWVKDNLTVDEREQLKSLVQKRTESLAVERIAGSIGGNPAYEHAKAITTTAIKVVEEYLRSLDTKYRASCKGDHGVEAVRRVNRQCCYSS